MESLEKAIELLSEVIDDSYVPKNIRDICKKAHTRLTNKEERVHIRMGAAIGMLDELSQDSNLPFNTRTQIWEIASLLETCCTNYKC